MNYEIGSYYKRCYDEYLYAVFQVVHVNGTALTVKLITDYGEQFKKEGNEAGFTVNAVATGLYAATTMTTGYNNLAIGGSALGHGLSTCSCACGTCLPRETTKYEKLYYTETDKRDALMTKEEYAYELL